MVSRRPHGWQLQAFLPASWRGCRSSSMRGSPWCSGTVTRVGGEGGRENFRWWLASCGAHGSVCHCSTRTRTRGALSTPMTNLRSRRSMARYRESSPTNPRCIRGGRPFWCAFKGSEWRSERGSPSRESGARGGAGFAAERGRARGAIDGEDSTARAAVHGGRLDSAISKGVAGLRPLRRFLTRTARAFCQCTECSANGDDSGPHDQRLQRLRECGE